MPGTVLVVDDDAMILRMLCSMLREFGYQSKGVGTTAEADAALSSASFVGMVLDYNLPSEDGLAFVRRHLATDRPLPPILLISGCSRSSLAPSMANLPIAGFLPKPFELKTLQAWVEGLFGAND